MGVGRWVLDDGRWVLDDGRWTMDDKGRRWIALESNPGGKGLMVDYDQETVEHWFGFQDKVSIAVSVSRVQHITGESLLEYAIPAGRDDYKLIY